MNPIATQQAALDNALVPSKKRLKIERCNARISFSKPQKEETYQVTLEALKLSPSYPAFVITTEGSYGGDGENAGNAVVELQCNILFQSTDECQNLLMVLGPKEVGCLRCSRASYPWSPLVPFPHQVDTVGFEFGQNRKNKHFGPWVDTRKFYEIPHSFHNKKDLVNHVDNNYHRSSDCNLDEDPFAGDQGTKRRKSRKDAKPSKGSKSKESKSSRCSKGTQSQRKSLGKSTQAEEPEFEAANTKMHQDQGNKSGHIDDQPDNKAATKHDCTIAKARQPPRTFDELMGTTIDFLAYVMNRLKIENLTQGISVEHGFNLLKVTCKSFAELEYYFEECYKAANDKLDWNNPKEHAYPFDLSKPLPLIED
nr:hypothetical protein [Tanacetum cinerariifolium]